MSRVFPLAAFFYELFISILVPRFIYAPKISQAGVIPVESRPIGTRQRQQLLRRCLLWNLSFGLEARFRLNLYRELSTWNMSPLGNFHQVKDRLEHYLLERPKFASRVIPSEGLGTMFCAFGFFSLAPKIRVSGLSWLNLNLMSLSARLRIWKGVPFRYEAVIRDFKKIRNLTDGFLSAETIEFLGHTAPNISPNEANPITEAECLIVGPGPLDFLPEISRFSKVLLIATLSENPASLKDKILDLAGVPVLADGLCAHLVGNGVLSSQLLDALSNAEEIVCSSRWHEYFSGLIPAKLLPLEANLSLLYSSGAPMGLQRTLGVAMRMNLYAVVFGAPMYASTVVYRNSSQISAEADRHSGNVESHFQSCLGLAGHDPISNFLVTKSLVAGGQVIGGEEFIALCSLSLEDYLLRIEKTLGSSRA